MVELALSPDRRWTATPSELVTACAAAGFSAVGVLGDDVDARVVHDYRSTGVRCHEVLALILGDDASDAVSSAEQLAEAARAIEAEWIVTVFTTGLSSATAKVIERCAAIFATAGSGMAVEFSPLGPVPNINEAMDIVRVADRGTGHAGLLVDSWHFLMGDQSWDDLARVATEIAYVQFTDALAPESDRLVRETLHRRAVPGEGVLDLDRFSTTLLERGWDGTVSVEVLSAELRTLPVSEMVHRLHDATAPYWS